MGGDSAREAGWGGDVCGCVAAPRNGPSPFPVPLGVCLGPGRRGGGVPLQPFLLPVPGSTFRAFGGSGLPNACGAATNFSPGHAGSPARTLATSIGLRLDSVQLEGAPGGGVRPPWVLATQGSRGLPQRPHREVRWWGVRRSPYGHSREPPNWVTPLTSTSQVNVCPDTRTDGRTHTGPNIHTERWAPVKNVGSLPGDV